MISILGGDGKEYGPVGVEQIKRWLNEGRLTLDTPARAEGSSIWKKVGDFVESPPSPFTIASTPPPIPSATEATSPSKPEEVLEWETVLASRVARFAAALIDSALTLLFVLPGMIHFTLEILQRGTKVPDLMSIDWSAYPTTSLLITAGVFLSAAIQSTLLALRSQSLGKICFKIRIVDVNTEEKAGFVKAVLFRSFVPGLISALPFIGGLFSIFNILFIFRQDRRCIHDLIASTKVVELE